MNGNIDYEKIGKSIKALRNEKKITQVELGNLIGRSESSIRKYEKGLIEIPNSILEDIAKALDISIYELLGIDKITTKDFRSASLPTYNESIDTINSYVEIIINNWVAYEDKTPKEVMEEIKNLPPHYAKMLADYIRHINNDRVKVS